MSAPLTDRLRMIGTALGLNVAAAATPWVGEAIDGALALERYLVTADMLGVPRARAAEILREAQGEWVGSTPRDADLEEVRRLLAEEAMTR